MKNLKDLSKKYLEEDEAAEQGQNKELLEKRRQLMDEFKARQVRAPALVLLQPFVCYGNCFPVVSDGVVLFPTRRSKVRQRFFDSRFI